MAEKSETKSDWKRFFTFEKEFLDFLSQQKILAGDRTMLKYNEVTYKNSILERPPKFIHCVVSLNGDESLIKKVEAEIEELKKRYNDVSTRGYPSRLPNLLKQPLQINISQHEAFRSRVIDTKTNDFVQVRRYSSESESTSLEDVAALNDIGIKTEIHEKSFGKTLNLSSADLLSYAKASKLTVRESSGLQYTARVRFSDNYQAVRMSYGLLIIPDDCPVLSSLPQARRAHRLETSKEKLILPIECDSEIFIKEA
jgi:hypothetical protein